jgi:hypothetical protein
MRKSLVLLAVACIGLLTPVLPSLAAPSDELRISGPFVHDNLAIYLVHGASSTGSTPLTLQEAMEKQVVRVHETGSVNQLDIENTSDQEIFVQSGDIVKGGRQDRVLTASLVLPAFSGRIPIASFCVEHGRWSGRGSENAQQFSSSQAMVPTREAKVAMKAPPPGRTAYREAVAGQQGEIWSEVARVQKKLSNNVGAPVASSRSETSLQLTLENDKLQGAQSAYVDALRPIAEKDADVVGYVFAINGRLNSADIYPSNGLFRKMWPKLLRSNATEAISAKDSKSDEIPAVEAVKAFLDAAERGKSSEKALIDGVRLEIRDADKALYFETKRVTGAWIHRNYLAK